MMSAPTRSPVDGSPVLHVVARAEAPPLDPPTVAAAGYAMAPDDDGEPVGDDVWAEILRCLAWLAVVVIGLPVTAWLVMEMLR